MTLEELLNAHSLTAPRHDTARAAKAYAKEVLFDLWVGRAEERVSEGLMGEDKNLPHAATATEFWNDSPERLGYDSCPSRPEPTLLTDEEYLRWRRAMP